MRGMYMGALSHFDLNKYNADIFIETGTYEAGSLLYAMNYHFQAYYSCEINKFLYDVCVSKFVGIPHVKIYNCDSLAFLNKILPDIPKEKSIVYWLDAHLPGAYSEQGILADKFSSEDTIENEINFPVTHEINIIYKYRKNCKDTILIDDLRTLIPLDREEVEKMGLFLNYSGLGFLDCFRSSHSIKEDHFDQGYLEIIPKEL